MHHGLHCALVNFPTLPHIPCQARGDQADRRLQKCRKQVHPMTNLAQLRAVRFQKSLGLQTGKAHLAFVLRTTALDNVLST